MSPPAVGVFKNMTALRRNTTTYINSSPGDPCVMLVNYFHPHVTLRVRPFFFSMNTVHKTRKLSTHFIYLNIYTNDSRSN